MITIVNDKNELMEYAEEYYENNPEIYEELTGEKIKKKEVRKK